MRCCITIFVCLVLFSCNSDDAEEYDLILIEPRDYSEQNEQEINDYLIANELISEKSETGLHYIILDPGEGIQPDKDSNVTVIYKGYLLDDNLFDEGPAEGFTTDLNTVIEGFSEGVTYLKEGGSSILFIPAHLGFSPNRSYPVGVYEDTVVIYEIQLLSVN